jgi:cytochrome bd ubiquinol oxidase subunit II
MSKADAAAAILWVGITFYTVFGGADFGAGFWSLIAGGSELGQRARRLIDWAIGPVWEANHVWLIFVLVILWTAFSTAFGSIMSTLFIPISLAALGIVFRGAGFAFHEVARRDWAGRLSEWLFGVSSILTPFFLGTVVGAIAAGRVPVGNAEGDPITSWLNPLSLSIGVLFVATGAYLAAIFLITDARHRGDDELSRYFARRATVAAAATGVVAVVGLIELHAEARYIFDRMTAEALPLVIVSLLSGLAALVLLYRGSTRVLRPLGIVAVVAIVWAWGVAQFPYLLPEDLTISAGAGTSATLTMIFLVFGVAVVLVLPAIGLLFVLQQRSHLESE